MVGVLVRLALGGEGGRKNAVVSSREFAADGRLDNQRGKEREKGGQERKVDRGKQGGSANKRRTRGVRGHGKGCHNGDEGE